MPELAELYDVLTPMEFLTFMAQLYNLDTDVANDRIYKMLAAFGLSNNTDQRMDTFSKGMRQKVLIYCRSSAQSRHHYIGRTIEWPLMLTV